ncbi:MAG: hypothetical protein AAF990_09775 [Bacteroidota bacterium]
MENKLWRNQPGSDRSIDVKIRIEWFGMADKMEWGMVASNWLN